jgi:hypothetical protein
MIQTDIEHQKALRDWEAETHKPIWGLKYYEDVSLKISKRLVDHYLRDRLAHYRGRLRVCVRVTLQQLGRLSRQRKGVM